MVGPGNGTTIRKTEISALMELAFYSNTLDLLTVTGNRGPYIGWDGESGGSAGKLLTVQAVTKL